MDLIQLSLLVIVLAYILVFFFHILWKTHKLEPQLRYYYYGIAFFLVLYFVCKLLLFINDILYYDTDGSQKLGPLYLISTIIVALAIFGLMFVVEKYVYDKLHYIPSIIILMCVVLMIVLPTINDVNMVTTYIIISSCMAVVVPLLYIIVGLKVSGRARKKSFILALGIVILLLGNLFNMYLLRETAPIFNIISPLTILIGLIFFHYGLLIYQTEK